jgi:hypothetical protein
VVVVSKTNAVSPAVIGITCFILFVHLWNITTKAITIIWITDEVVLVICHPYARGSMT